MGKVIIMKETTEKPLSLIGKCAGVCWGSKDEEEANLKRGRECLLSGHFRTAEFPQIYMILDGYSARVIREFYTHIGGMPTRLQASTRYIEYGNFDYVTPPHIQGDAEAENLYDLAMAEISSVYKKLEEKGMPKEDIANLLPLGMETKVVVRTNLRNLIDMSRQRLCSRAYSEFRGMFLDIAKALFDYSLEWAEVTYNFFKPKCEIANCCVEKNSCGRYKKEDLEYKSFVDYNKK